MSKFAKFTLIKFVLPTDTSSEEFCTAYYFLHGSLEGKFSVVKSCNTILFDNKFIQIILRAKPRLIPDCCQEQYFAFFRHFPNSTSHLQILQAHLIYIKLCVVINNDKMDLL